MSSNIFDCVSWYKGMFEKMENPLNKGDVILDFGCGIGECVHQFRNAGYTVYGCDIEFPNHIEESLESYMRDGVIRKIDYDPNPDDQLGKFLETGQLVTTEDTSFHIPFEDNTFDIIVSNQVFEHVLNYSATLAEIQRITKPQGVNLHVFPGKWKIRESHTYVPFSSVLKNYYWLYLWALLGIRNEYQTDKSAAETAKRNYWYLHRRTHYLSQAQISRYAAKYFNRYKFREDIYYYLTPKTRHWFERFPLSFKIYQYLFSELTMRVLVLRDKKV